MTVLEQLAEAYPYWTRVRLTRIVETAGSGAIRDVTIEGLTPSLPELARQFILYAEPRDYGDYRQVCTNLVEEVIVSWGDIGKPCWRFTTLSGSIYEIQLVPPGE